MLTESEWGELEECLTPPMFKIVKDEIQGLTNQINRQMEWHPQSAVGAVKLAKAEGEIGRLKKELSDATVLAFKNGQGWLKAVAENGRLRAENQAERTAAQNAHNRWTGVMQDLGKLQAEIGRLRVTLERAEKHLALSAEQSHPQAEIHALVSELRAARGCTL